MTRIGRGTWKGHVLRPDFSCRPTTALLRGAVFDIIGPSWPARTQDESIVWDLCCGSASVGLEALSCGFGMGVFVDTNGRAIRFVRAFLGARESEERGVFVRGDVRRVVDSLPGPADMIFLDPPYNSCEGLHSWALSRDWQEALVPEGYLFLEGPSDLQAAGSWRRRRYGDSALFWLRREDQ